MDIRGRAAEESRFQGVDPIKFCGVALAGAEHEHRRHLYKDLAREFVEVRELADACEVLALA